MYALAEQAEAGTITLSELRAQVEFFHEAKMLGGRMLTADEEVERGYVLEQSEGDFKIPDRGRRGLGPVRAS